MRDVVFFVADGTMEQAFLGFLTRNDKHKHYNLDTAPFDFDPAQDLIRIPGNDPGVFNSAPEWVLGHTSKHRHAVVVFDLDHGTEYETSYLRDDLTKRIRGTGWTEDRFKVIVIEPELEAWIWQRNQKVAKSLKFASVPEMVKAVQDAKIDWPDGQDKPSRPKEALEAVATKRRGIGFSSAIHKSITSVVSATACQDAAFQELKATLQAWFPVGDQA